MRLNEAGDGVFGDELVDVGVVLGRFALLFIGTALLGELASPLLNLRLALVELCLRICQRQYRLGLLRIGRFQRRELLVGGRHLRGQGVYLALHLRARRLVWSLRERYLQHLHLRGGRLQLGADGSVRAHRLRETLTGLRFGLVESGLLFFELCGGRIQAAFGGVEGRRSLGEFVVGLAQNAVVDVVYLVLRETHLQRVGDAACRRDVSHAVLTLQRGDDGVLHILRQLAHALVRISDAQIHGRHHVHADLHVGGRARGVGQLAGHAVDRRRGLHQRRVHVGAVGELQKDHRVVLRRLALHGRDPAQAAERPFEHVGDLFLHLLGRRAGVGGDYGQIRHLKRRQEVGLHVRDRHRAQDQDDDDGHEHVEGFLHGESSEHGKPFGEIAQMRT